MRAEYYEKGNQFVGFGRHQGRSVWWVVEHDWGYIQWCLDQPSPSNAMMNFLRAALDYRTLKEDWENADLRT